MKDNPDALGAGQTNGQKSEVYVDKIAAEIGTEGTVSTFQYGNAIGNVGAHEVGHNLGKNNAPRPAEGATSNNVMVVPPTRAELTSNMLRFID